ncbi:uncharacterized protein LOC134681753 [Mytilus trossulus]|uniref:uncharacterized protein LOC134681753 n=1 Tax=Mytilus trossulus TaxID=6551 RepID=UPI00300599F2
MIFILKFVMFQLVYLHINACTDLELLTNPVVFNEKVQLACKANGTEIPLDKPHSRSWSGGPYNALLCMNGISANRLKYNEIPGKDKSQYILEINSFSESDVDCEYKCQFGVDITRKTLQLNEEDYEYIPSPETTTVTATLQHGHFRVNVHFDKIWPTPICEIIFEKINFGKRIEMSKRKNGKLYAVDISLQHAFRKEDCNGEMVISCKIGTKHIEVQRKQFNTCPINGHSKKSSFLNDYALIALVVAVFMILVMVFVIMVFLIIKQKGYISSICEELCFYSRKTRYETQEIPSPDVTDVRIHLTSEQQH